MKLRLVDLFFILIGTAVGIILSLQIQAKPPRLGSFPLDQLEIQKSLLQGFSSEQDILQSTLAELDNKLQEVQETIERKSSKQTTNRLNYLKSLTGFNAPTGEGVRITMSDNPEVARNDFSSLNENFVQATDLRDMANALFLQDATAISINGRRITPLTPIQPVFDTILVGNFQITAPFTIEAVGPAASLSAAPRHIETRKIHVFVETIASLKLNPLDSSPPPSFLSLTSL